MSTESPPPPASNRTSPERFGQSQQSKTPSPISPPGPGRSPSMNPASPKKAPSPADKRQHSSPHSAEQVSTSTGNAGANSTHQQFCLRWNNYQSNLTNVFDQLLQNESFVDVTLACDGQSIKAHKMVLSACSPYFQTLFFENPCQHPIIIMRDVKWLEMKHIVDFMYKGEINVSQDQIGPLLKIAEMLKIRGLADVNTESAAAEVESAIKSEPEVPPKKARLSRDWVLSNLDINITPPSNRNARKTRWPSMDISNTVDSPLAPCSSSQTPESRIEIPSPTTPTPSVATPTLAHHHQQHQQQQQQQQLMQQAPQAAAPQPTFPLGPPMDPMTMPAIPMSHVEDLEIKPGIAEMIREEERAKLMENSHAWMGASTSSIADSYQYQLQSMWQKCWNTNQNLMHHLRFRERGPLKSWRPETMAEAIFSVLKEGLSLSQAARKYDIPYPTFVLYANRVHNMLGPSIDGGTDLRPKGRGRPQRILLGIWPDDHIKGVIKTVVFRDAKELKDDSMPMQYGRHSPVFPFQDGGMNYQVGPCSNGLQQSQQGQMGESMSPEATAAAVAAVAHGLRQQMQMAAAVQHHSDAASNLFNMPSHLQGHPTPKQSSPAANSSSNAQRRSPSIASQGGHPSMGGLSSMHIAALTGNQVPVRDGSVITSSAGSFPPASSLCTPPSSSRNHISPSQHLDSAHDLRMNSPEESPLNSPMEMALEPAVNLAVGVSGLPYKPPRDYASSPRVQNLFQDDIANLVADNSRNCPSGMSTFKEPQPNMGNMGNMPNMANIKIEPMTECRTD